MKDKNKILNKISSALNANDLETARKLIENDLKRVGSREEYYFYLALITKDLNKKLELYTQALNLNEKYLDAWINRGLVNNELGNYEASIKDYDKAIELDSKCALAFNNRGYTKFKQQNYEGALEDYNKAILLNPKFQMALDNKALLFQTVCMKDDKDFEEKYVPYQFERLCTQYLIRENRQGRIEPIFERIGKYYYDDPVNRTNGEFDIVTEDENGYVFYEAKFRKNPLHESIIRHEIEQVKATGMNCYKYGFISRSGFDMKPDEDMIFISLAEMYACQ